MFVIHNQLRPACRNGRRGRLKICCGQPRAGSSPAAGSIKNRLEASKVKVSSDFFILYLLITLIQIRKKRTAESGV